MPLGIASGNEEWNDRIVRKEIKGRVIRPNETWFDFFHKLTEPINIWG
jgi:hypothetical protein